MKKVPIAFDIVAGEIALFRE
ncbi:unnamed protein product, partial [Allacma fusca]